MIMKTAMVMSEAVSLVVLLMLFLGSIIENKSKHIKNTVYKYAVVDCMIAVITDMLSWSLNGYGKYSHLIFVTNLMSYVMGYSMTMFLCVYLIETIKEKKEMSSVPEKVIQVAFVIANVFVVAGSLAHKVFYIEDGYYQVGDWYVYAQIFTTGIMIYSLYLLIMNARLLGRHDTIALLSYVFFPTLSAIMHYIIPEVSFTFIAVVFSELTIYIMLQAEQQAEFRLREKVLMEVSHTDTLTKLQNRLAYDEARQELLTEPRIVALFCDVNGLKYTNDNFGHKAGDKLIAEFGDVLKQFFRHENIYRISGDEFVILFPVTDDDAYRKRVDEFRQMLESQERPIASMGSSSGEGAKVREIIKDAESKMYEDKKLFHEKFPDYKGR